MPGHDGPCCPQCARESSLPELCGNCLRHPPHFDAVLAPYLYRFPVDRLVQQLKFRQALELARLFAHALLARIRAQALMPQAIIAVPLSRQRLRERGFNQALEIARYLAKRLELPLRHECQRTRDTPAQMGLSLAERRRSVRGAFRCTGSLSGLHIAVVDDVMTSGATLDEVAKTLKGAGATRVTGWIVSRTPER